MNIANHLDFAKYPSITVLSQQDLKEKYRQVNPWRPWAPSPLSLVKFYIEKEKPQHVMVDELPFEKSSWKQLLRVQTWILAKLLWRFGLMGFTIHFAIWFLLCLPPLLWGGLWGVAIPFGILLILTIWFFVGLVVNPINLDKTGFILTSLPALLPPSSFFWLALHSSPFTDRLDTASPLSEKKLESWKGKLTLSFEIPGLKQNLRNSREVASTKGPFGEAFDKLINAATLYTSQSKALPTAPAPRPLPTLPPTPVFLPIHLPIHSTSKLGEAVKYAYASLDSPTNLVLLLENINQHDVVKTSLAQEGLNVVTYSQPKERPACESFLKNPVGVLVTTPEIFSGMEAGSVLWVRVAGKFSFQRSNALRAIHKFCVIETGSNSVRRKVFTGFKADGTFSKCHKPWFGDLYWCKSCNSQPILLCPHCANVCHQSCEREVAKLRTFLHSIIQFNPCSCKTSGDCKLKPPRRIPLWRILGPSSWSLLSDANM